MELVGTSQVLLGSCYDEDGDDEDDEDADEDEDEFAGCLGPDQGRVSGSRSRRRDLDSRSQRRPCSARELGTAPSLVLLWLKF